MTTTERDEPQLPSDVALSMRAKDKSKYVQKIILDALDAHRAGGLSISELAETTGFSRETLSKHLDILVASREAYKAGESSARYHKNGRIVHYHHMDNKLFGKRLYTFYELNNPDGDFIFLQEKEMGEFRTIRDKGGIVIAKNDLPRFMAELKAFAGEIAKEEKK
jgi:DNA-binding transcriptional ArsR family regulator